MKTESWKEGVLPFDLVSLDGSTLTEGTKVLYKKQKLFDENNVFTGMHEYHYTNMDGSNLIRSYSFTIEEKTEVIEAETIS